MANVTPTESELLEALEKKRQRAKKQRLHLRERWEARGKTVMTASLAREIRDFKANNPDWSHREIGEHFNVSALMVGRVLRLTIYPNA